MRLLYVADARSPIATNWIRYFIQRGDEVHVISSTPCAATALPGAASFQVVPIALSALHPENIGSRSGSATRNARPFTFARLRHGTLAQFITDARYLISSIEIHRHVSAAAKIIREIQPDLVHALRIPFEGILAALAVDGGPLLTSTWGNDLTLFARRYPTIGSLTRKTMQRTTALHCDCHRDLELAPAWGFDPSKPAVVLPGSGGVQSELFKPGVPDCATLSKLNIARDAQIVINPRGFRGYVRNDTFFRAIPLILNDSPRVVFLCSAMAGNPVAEEWIRRLGVESAVRLLPSIAREEMATYFRLAEVSVSLSEHDGTPNTLLEAMASGCLPVAGNIDTVREWIDDGVNGLLCDPANPVSVANAILKALDRDFQEQARATNLRLIKERADYDQSMARATAFYHSLIKPTEMTFAGSGVR